MVVCERALTASRWPHTNSNSNTGSHTPTRTRPALHTPVSAWRVEAPGIRVYCDVHMSLLSPFDSWSRRLAVYGYLAPLFTDRKVLELGCGDGLGAARLRALGAASVLGVDADAASLSRAQENERMPGLQFAPLERRRLESAGAFDLIVVPEGAAWLRPGAPFGPTAVRGLLAPKGRLAVVVASADWPDANPDHAGSVTGGLGYYALVEELERLFPHVRMFGLTPFAAFGAAEFGAETAGLRIEGGLVEEGADQPTHYLALAGQDEGGELGYTLLQIPAARRRATESAHVGAASDEARPGGLRRRLAEAEGQAEGVLRVSRAQTEEIEELRARLRRAAEARGELDQEVIRLRRALADADASVLDLTRRTREEVAALARQIAGGLRAPEPAAGKIVEGAGMARLREELRRRGEELAARDSALSERDERIAALEAEKQDLLWRLKAAVAKDSRAQPAPPRGQNGAARPDDATAEERAPPRAGAARGRAVSASSDGPPGRGQPTARGAGRAVDAGERAGRRSGRHQPPPAGE